MDSQTLSRKPVFIPKKEQMSVSIARASELVCISASYLYREVRTGRLPAKKVGSRIIVTIEDLKEWIAKQRSFIKKG